MKLLAFAASTSTRSINRQLVRYAADVAAELVDGLEVDLLDLNDFEMPIFSQDRQDADGIPQLAHDFYARIGQADAIIVSFAEHNGSYSAAYKNTYDWASRIDMQVYQNTPMVMLATAPGGRGGAGVLEAAVATAPFFGMDLRGQVSVPTFGENFDTEAGRLTDPDLDAQLRSAVAALVS